MIRHVVKAILENPDNYHWTIQGLGMLRTYFSPELRLHVWSPEHELPKVTKAHSHPWDFESYVVAGRMTNIRFFENEYGAPFMAQVIKCGCDAYTVGEPEHRRFLKKHPEVYVEGDSYQQIASEIHCTIPDPGTVTIIRRQFGADVDHATVICPQGEPWVSAEPRPATLHEIHEITQNALKTWF